MPKYIIGIDIGGTKTAVALVAKKGEIIERREVLTASQKKPSATIESILTITREILAHKKISRKDIEAIGVGAPGQVLPDKGIIVSSPNLPQWKNVPLRKILQKEFGLPVILDNDANAAACGELKFGAGRGIKNFIYLTVSTGIGGGIVINGQIYRGADNVAGEIGHTIIDVNGPLCGCGRRGCLESFASGTAIARRAKTDALTVEKAALKGDPHAKKIIAEAAEYLAIGIGNVINIFNPEKIIIGGGIANMGELLFKPVREGVKKYALSVPAKTAKIVPAQLGRNAGVLGAAALCL